jgi:hypothetical protein
MPQRIEIELQKRFIYEGNFLSTNHERKLPGVFGKYNGTQVKNWDWELIPHK